MRKRSDGEIRRLIARAASPPAADIALSERLDAATILSHPPGATHHIHDYLGLVGALGVSSEPLPPRVTISQEETKRTAAGLKLPVASQERPLLGMSPGAEYGPAKRWPAESFIAAGIAIEKATHCRWVIFGGPSDMEIAGLISRGIGRSAATPVINLAGQTTLRALAAALKSCRLLLTNDTGPMHLAAAVGTPVVVPFGSTAPEMTGPTWTLASELLRAPGIPCTPCFRRECPIDFRCMTRIAPDVVVAAALRSLAISAPQS
jgi:heptosyltransferase-2